MVKNGVQRVDHALARESPRAGEHLEEHGAQRKEIGRRSGGFAAHLLGSHVARGAEQPAVGRRFDGGGSVGQRAAIGRGETRQAEVEHLGGTRRVEDDVLGLEIAMHEPRA